jgi:hypothetical protein
MSVVEGRWANEGVKIVMEKTGFGCPMNCLKEIEEKIRSFRFYSVNINK